MDAIAGRYGVPVAFAQKPKPTLAPGAIVLLKDTGVTVLPVAVPFQIWLIADCRRSSTSVQPLIGVEP